MTSKAVIFAIVFAIIATVMFIRTRPRSPDFRTECGIPVQSPHRTLTDEYQGEIRALIRSHLNEHGNGDCKKLDGVTLRFAKRLNCRGSENGKCSGTYDPNTREITLRYAEPFSSTSIRTELEHALHGEEGKWDHVFSLHVDGGAHD